MLARSIAPPPTAWQGDLAQDGQDTGKAFHMGGEDELRDRPDVLRSEPSKADRPLARQPCSPMTAQMPAGGATRR